MDDTFDPEKRTLLKSALGVGGLVRPAPGGTPLPVRACGPGGVGAGGPAGTGVFEVAEALGLRGVSSSPRVSSQAPPAITSTASAAAIQGSADRSRGGGAIGFGAIVVGCS